MGTVSNRKSASRTRGVRKTRVADATTETSVTRPGGPNYRLILGLSAVGAVVSLFLIPLLTERPGGERQLATRDGGESVIEKTPVPRAPSPEPQLPPASPDVAPAPAESPGLTGFDQSGLPPGVTLSGPGFDVPAMPVPSQSPAEQSPFPQGIEAQDVASAPSPPLPDRTPEVPSAPPPEPQQAAPDALPWQSDDAGARRNQEMASLPPQDSGPVDLPGRSEIRGWARSAAREFVGGVDADGMPLYRFDVWLDAPAGVRSQIRSVSYEYRAPSAQPPTQSSTASGDGFRVKFGAAACAEKATITLVMRDGQQRSVDVDGCKILN